MFGVFIDDSGSDAQSPFMLLAALVAKKEAWDQFSLDWQAAIDADKPIDYFKSSEAATLTECFAGFTRKEAEAKTNVLTDIALKRIHYGLLTTILWCDFTRIMKPHRPKPQGTKRYFLKHPYFACFHHIINNVGQAQINLRLKGKVDFMFDEQGKEGLRCKRLFDELKPDMPEPLRALFGEVYFGNDKTVLPLQAADLIAWQNRNKNLAPHKQSTHSYTKIVNAGKFGYDQVDAEMLRDFILRDFNLLPNS